LVLDYGGVLTLPQDVASVEQMVAYLRVDGDLFRRVYRRNRPAFDSGAATDEQYWRAVVEECGLNSSEVDVEPLIALDVQSWTQLNGAMVQFVQDVRSQVYRLAMISNMTRNTLVAMRRELPWLALFDECVFSCELGVNKPDAAIYRECARRLGLQASECLFVDDSAKNVQGARDVGMAAIRFEAMEQFLFELERYDLVR
jgi:putative hydrolase of the HAD superfamily